MQHAYAVGCVAPNAYHAACGTALAFLFGGFAAASRVLRSQPGLGYNGRIYMNGEEIAEGRCFAHLMDGNSYELPWLGKFAHENSVAHPATWQQNGGRGLDDTSPRGQVYIYIGDKTESAIRLRPLD